MLFRRNMDARGGRLCVREGGDGLDRGRYYVVWDEVQIRMTRCWNGLTDKVLEEFKFICCTCSLSFDVSSFPNSLAHLPVPITQILKGDVDR